MLLIYCRIVLSLFGTKLQLLFFRYITLNSRLFPNVVHYSFTGLSSVFGSQTDTCLTLQKRQKWKQCRLLACLLECAIYWVPFYVKARPCIVSCYNNDILDDFRKNINVWNLIEVLIIEVDRVNGIFSSLFIFLVLSYSRYMHRKKDSMLYICSLL